MAPNILLVNPWITDFAAYDFWIKPAGLLYIGSMLRKFGYNVSLLDCVDRHNPILLKNLGQQSAICRWDLTGKFYRQVITKPQVYQDVPRYYARYGYPDDVFFTIISHVPRPDVILMTSVMTFWYPGVKMAVSMLRQIFPGTPIVLGGIYATLCPDHASKTIQPDYLITGAAEVSALQLVADITNWDGKNFEYQQLDELPYPAFDLYPNLYSVPLLTSRGCPYQCTFCGSRLIAGKFRQRRPENVVQEIVHWYRNYHIQHFAFFDDALLLNKDRHIKGILNGIIEQKIPVHFHTPNGLHPHQLDLELANQMFRAGFRTIRLSYESVDPERQRQMHSKVSNEDLVTALDFLKTAGFTCNDIGVYVLMGLPGQPISEIIDSVQFVATHGARISLAYYSPIPGTVQYQEAEAMGLIQSGSDPLLTNNSIFPFKTGEMPYDMFQRIALWTKGVNRAVAQGEKIPGFNR